MAILTLAAKDLRLLLRDPRSAVILLVTPLLLILVLGLALGEGFGEKPDERLRVSIVNLDKGLPEKASFPEKPWSDVVIDDLSATPNLRIEVNNHNEATGSAYFFVVTQHGPDHWGRYRDHYVRVAGEWRFAHRCVRLDGRRDGAGC